MQFDPKNLSKKIDLTSCDQEPIHILGSIQPHGVLVVVQEPELIIVQVSENTSAHFGLSLDSLLGQPLARLLGADETQRLQNEILPRDLEATPQYLVAIPVGARGTNFERIIHRYQGQLILEFEPRPADAFSSLELYPALKSALSRLERTSSVREFCQMAAEEVQLFTGFDRVMVYKFLDDGAGTVIGESIRDGLEPYLGLHYPAADIPPQARALYLKSWLRFKVDVGDMSVPLVPQSNPVTNAPLDLSYAVLRAMSPIHTEYLKNIGATATMSLSIIRDGRLWGLVACHHQTGPKYVSHDRRMACEFLAHILSLQMAAKEDSETHTYVTHLNTRLAALVETMSAAEDYPRGLLDKDAAFLGWLDAGGVAICDSEQIYTIGQTPSEKQITRLTDWLTKNVTEEVYATDALSQVSDEFGDYASTAAGLLALRLGRREPRYILWFRPQRSQSVNWAGNPNKPVEVGEFGERLTPRKSFALWVEEVKGRSLPWQDCELEAVRKLRRSIYEIVVRKAEELERLNAELERSNIELDSFAYIASHDLKEPLRGIHNYSHFLLEDYTEKLDAEGVDKLNTLIKLTQRMESLIDSLLYYSRVGRAELAVRATNLENTLNETLELLTTRLQESGVEVRRPRVLPVVEADPERIGEVFANLITNAIKYNDKAQKWVEIGWQGMRQEGDRDQSQTDSPVPAPVFYVRDNGIGIAPEHHEHVFRIFKRLHGREDYGGGVGAGLTIVKKIIERHGGHIWLESQPGVGTTFYFTLSGDQSE